MQVRSIILLVISCAVALAVAFAMRGKSGQMDTSSNTRVLVAATDIVQGSFVLMDKQFTWQAWPEENLSPNLLVEGKFDPQKLNGAVARREILKGEPIIENAVVKSSEGGFMSAVLSPGMRAVSIAVDSTSGNAGFIFPGDKVDLMITHRISKDGRNEKKSQTLASETFIENVRILAVDQSLDNPQQTAMLAKTVTLEVSQEQAEKINVAKDLGKISLSLRSLATQNAEGREATEPRSHSYTRESDVSGLLNPDETSAKKVMLIRGKDREEVEFDQRGR